MAETARIIKQLPTSIYDKMEFPDYEFREFPLAVPVVNGVVQVDAKGKFQPYDERRKAHPVVIVNSQDELDVLKGGEAVLVPVNPDAVNSASRVESEDDIRSALYVQAEQAGAKIDKRWSIERIEKAIAAAEGEPVL